MSTLAYIVVLNPLILAAGVDAVGGKLAITAGTISYVVIKLAVGKAGEVHPILYGVAVLFVLYFLRGPLESVLL